MKKEMFDTNPSKASAKVTINSFMIGSLFFILTLIISLSPDRFNPFVIYQLVLAIPLLYVSSLSYSKVGYWKEVRNWDKLGWFTNTIGNLFVLNAIGLIAATFNFWLAITYFILFICLMLIYSYINIIHYPKTLGSKLFKFLFTLTIILLGGIIPIIF